MALNCIWLPLPTFGETTEDEHEHEHDPGTGRAAPLYEALLTEERFRDLFAESPFPAAAPPPEPAYPEGLPQLPEPLPDAISDTMLLATLPGDMRRRRRVA